MTSSLGSQGGPKRTRVALFGVTGYTGLELIEILLRHPRVALTYFASRREGEPRVSDIFPRLRGRCDARTAPEDLDAVAQAADVVLLALPHVVSKTWVPGLLKRGLTVIDLSADYRLRDPAVYARCYGEPHGDEENLAQAVYGLPELFGDELRGARLVAVPGCYPTAAVLAVAPLVSWQAERAGAPGLLGEVTVDAKTGVSGGGRNPTLGFHFPECNESVKPYNVGVHRHQPEMEQVLSDVAGRPVAVDFVPHLVPMDRGILSTAYVYLGGEVSQDAVRARYEEFYAGQPFVRLRPPGEYPATKDVSFTNFCDISVKVLWSREGKTKVACISAIDNLIKGAAGQAVECLNLVLGFPRTAALL
jgi:N-acetyl-gamma-glutamyl-phosphate reductase